MSETSKRKKEMKRMTSPPNNANFRIYRSDKVLHSDESGNFQQVNNYYFDNVEKVFIKRKLLVATLLIFVYITLSTLFYSKVYEISFWKAMFEYADNYLFVGGLTLIIFLVFKRKKSYNENGKG